MPLFIAAVVGIALGLLAANMLFLQWMTLIPWGLAGLLIGWFSQTKKQAINNGLLYGFFLGFVFMFAIYQGSAPIVTRIPFFIILGVVSAICGCILSLIGYFFKKKKK